MQEENQMVTAVVGANWGDEGKVKSTDMLAKESDIPYSSLNSLFLKNNQPTLSTLEKICKGFHFEPPGSV